MEPKYEILNEVDFYAAEKDGLQRGDLIAIPGNGSPRRAIFLEKMGVCGNPQILVVEKDSTAANETQRQLYDVNKQTLFFRGRFSGDHLDDEVNFKDLIPELMA